MELVTHLICMEIITCLPHNKMFAQITYTNFKKYSVGIPLYAHVDFTFKSPSEWDNRNLVFDKQECFWKNKQHDSGY